MGVYGVLSRVMLTCSICEASEKYRLERSAKPAIRLTSYHFSDVYSIAVQIYRLQVEMQNMKVRLRQDLSAKSRLTHARCK